jgi:hypothetical protein
MVRGKLTLIKNIKSYIASLGYSYETVPDAGSIILHAAGGKNNHYLMLIITGRNRTWEHERRHFSIAKLEVNNLKEAQKGINNYLKLK